MSAVGARRGKLSASLRALFAARLRPLSSREPDPAASTPPVASGGTPAEAGQPSQRLLTGPEPAGGTSPAHNKAQARPPAGALVQTGLFEQPGPQPGSRSRSLFITDFIARYHEAMRRGGLEPRDPLHPVLTMLGELLIHLTHLQADYIAVSERAADDIGGRVREEAARAQAGIAGEAREITRTVAQGAGHIEAAAAEVKQGREDVVRGFRADTEALLLKAVATQSRAYTWNTWVYTATMLALALVALAGGGYWYGRHVEREDMALVLEATKTPLVAAVLRDGRVVAEHWLHLMQWNHLDQAGKTCEPQQSGIGYRMVCNYILWNSQPLDTPPAASIANPKGSYWVPGW